jgi:hypothetical protein
MKEGDDVGVKTVKATSSCEKSHKMRQGLRLREVPVNNRQGAAKGIFSHRTHANQSLKTVPSRAPST